VPHLHFAGIRPTKGQTISVCVDGQGAIGQCDGTGVAPTERMNHVAVALFASAAHVPAVVDELLARGIDRDAVSVVSRTSEAQIAESAIAESETDADRASGVAAGAGAGAAVGGLGGLLLGLGALAVPGIGPVLAAGPVAAALAGAGLGAAAGGVVGSLTGLGIAEDDARLYAEALRRGGTLVAVRGDEAQAGMAAEVMAARGAEDVKEHAERWRSAGWPGFDPAADPWTDAMLREGGLGIDRGPSAPPIDRLAG